MNASEEQTIIIDISLECDLSLAAASDNLNDAGIDFLVDTPADDVAWRDLESICTANEFYLIEKLTMLGKQSLINY